MPEASPRLMDHVTELEQEIQRLEDALCNQELYVINGYVVTVWPVGDGSYVGSCPTLHACAQASTLDEAIADLRDAMATAIEGRKRAGSPAPPKDVTNRCLD